MAVEGEEGNLATGGSGSGGGGFWCFWPAPWW